MEYSLKLWFKTEITVAKQMEIVNQSMKRMNHWNQHLCHDLCYEKCNIAKINLFFQCFGWYNSYYQELDVE